MNINITPSAVAVDTAANLLTFIELARDPSKLKAVLDQIKEAQDAAAADVAKAQAIQAEAAEIAAAADKKAAQADSDLTAAQAESQRAAAALAEADAVRASIKTERNEFDGWMAQQREALAADRAKVASDADANKRTAADMFKLSQEIEAREAAAKAAQAAAEALREEYEQKMADLKAMVG